MTKTILLDDMSLDEGKGHAAHEAEFSHPYEVLHRRSMSTAEKRAILASWASDQHAVENLPAFRQLEGGEIVTLDSIMTALRLLDTTGWSDPDPAKVPNSRKPGLLVKLRSVVKRPSKRDDDGDDPPPCPAAARPPLLYGDLSMQCAA